MWTFGQKLGWGGANLHKSSTFSDENVMKMHNCKLCQYGATLEGMVLIFVFLHSHQRRFFLED